LRNGDPTIMNDISEVLWKWRCIDCISHWPRFHRTTNKIFSRVFKKMAALPSPTQVVLFMFI